MAHQVFFATAKINFLIFATAKIIILYAGVAELADAPDLGSGAARRGGSTPFTRTKVFYTSKITFHNAEVVQW